MSEALDLAAECPPATDGEIALINLDSARRRSWSRFWQDPGRPGIADAIVEQEQLTAQFVGDFSALDRLLILAATVRQVDAMSGQTALISAHVASVVHRFSEARRHLDDAARLGAAPSEAVHRLRLSIDQACETDLEDVLEARRCAAKESGKLEDLLPLGALLADLYEVTEADEVYRRALRVYRDVSPFVVSLICFQLGVLWGEIAPEPRRDIAERWYGKAIDYVPSYPKARVHLSEIYLGSGRIAEAEALLRPVASCGDPEVSWRLADIMALLGKRAEAEKQIQAARCGVAMLLDQHLLAFADHGAEFFAGSGNDLRRALELALINVENRPTVRAFERAYHIAIEADDADVAAKLLATAIDRWGGSPRFRLSSLARR